MCRRRSLPCRKLAHAFSRESPFLSRPGNHRSFSFSVCQSFVTFVNRRANIVNNSINKSPSINLGFPCALVVCFVSCPSLHTQIAFCFRPCQNSRLICRYRQPGAVRSAVFRCSSVFTSLNGGCLLYTSPSPRDATLSRMPSSA